MAFVQLLLKGGNLRDVALLQAFLQNPRQPCEFRSINYAVVDRLIVVVM